MSYTEATQIGLNGYGYGFVSCYAGGNMKSSVFAATTRLKEKNLQKRSRMKQGIVISQRKVYATDVKINQFFRLEIAHLITIQR